MVSRSKTGQFVKAEPAKKRGWPKGKPRGTRKPSEPGSVFLLAHIDQRLDAIERKLLQIMATNQELAEEVQKLAAANTEQTTLIEAEHQEVMAKLDEMAAAGSVDQAVLDSLRGEIDKVSANNEAIKAILPTA